MARPRKCRKVCCMPISAEFVPAVKGEDGSVVVLAVDEYEAVRLIDKEGFSQEEAGEYMHVARTTIQQIYTSARKKIADALVDGSVLRIEGGDYSLCDGMENYCGCGGCRKHRCIKESESELSGGNSMKVMIPLDEDKKSVCVSFGRAPLFMIFDSETGEKSILENPAADAQGGAGIKAAQFVADSGATSLITVRCGENAGEVFKAADIKVYKAEGTKADENLEAFKEGKLEELTHFHAGFHGIQ